MNPLRLADLPAVLRNAAAALSALPDLADLPALAEVELSWDKDADALKLAGQLRTHLDNDTNLTALAVWAGALNTTVHQDPQMHVSFDHGYLWQRVSVAVTLPGGTVFEVWDHLHHPLDTREPIPA